MGANCNVTVPSGCGAGCTAPGYCAAGGKGGISTCYPEAM